MSTARNLVMLDTPCATTHAAGLRAMHLTLAMSGHARLQALPFPNACPLVLGIARQELELLRRAFKATEQELPRLRETPADRPLPATLLRALGRDLATLPNPAGHTFARTVAFSAVVDAALSAEGVRRGRQEDLLLAGSSWQAKLLGAAGLDNVLMSPPGVDTRRFHDRNRHRRFGDRFVVFAGGHLDFRKGQDLVIAAVRAFRERFPETLLVTCWQHPWPERIRPFTDTAHVRGMPEVHGGALAITPWLEANGLPADSVVDLGAVANASLADVLQGVDAGLFVSRAEAEPPGALLECMASGVPTIVASHTGQAEFAQSSVAYPLERVRPVTTPVRDIRSTDGWGEAAVEEIVHALEALHAGRGEAARRARAAREMVAPLGWSTHGSKLLELLEPIFTSVDLPVAA